MLVEKIFWLNDSTLPVVEQSILPEILSKIKFHNFENKKIYEKHYKSKNRKTHLLTLR